MTEQSIINQLEDPFYQFECWCRENGFADVADYDPERIDLSRLDAAVSAYAAAETAFEQIMSEPLRSCSLCGEPEFVFGVELNEESECAECAAKEGE